MAKKENSANQERYIEFSQKHATGSPVLKNTVIAFVSGGLICVLGQAIFELYTLLDLKEDTTKALVSATLILISCILTGLGLYDKIAKFCGAGTLVPITGFANAVASPAMEYKSEGLIMGVGAKMFTVAGPVVVYGVLFSAIYGVIYYICSVCCG